MVALKSPLIDAKMDDQTRLYVAVLERQVLGLTVNELKYRALLEMLTGETWDDLATDMESGELERIATEATAKKLGITVAQASRVVRENRDKANKQEQQA